MTCAKPLLKFKNDEAYLDPQGLELIEGLESQICPVIFIGDGRGGKSYLASRVCQVDGVFTSSDSAEPVTEGIDIYTCPVDDLIKACPSVADDLQPPTPGEVLLVMDCEGGNNAMAAIRTLVNVFGIAISSLTVFVAAGLLSEAALQNLSASLAARSLIKYGDVEENVEQRLIFVVNKNMLKYEDDSFDKLLEEPHKDAGRAEMRQSIKEFFQRRRFLPVPMMGTPDFDPKVQELCTSVLRHRRPLMMGGTPVLGKQLCGLLSLIITEVRKSNEVSYPSMHRFVILDGFLTPTAVQLVEESRGQFPELEDYDPDVDSKDPRTGILKIFDEKVAHVSQKALVNEARTALEEKLQSLWDAVQATNDAFGNQVKEIKTETREVLESTRPTKLGGKSLLKKLSVTAETYKVEVRTASFKKRGGPPVYSEWVEQGHINRLAESALERTDKLPVLKGNLYKVSPSFFRRVLTLGKGTQQQRSFILKDGHLFWWELESQKMNMEAAGMLNFLVHRAEVVSNPNDSMFLIRPAEPIGWTDTSTFSGGDQREFCFDAKDSEHTASEWVKAIQEHAEFGRECSEQISFERIMHEVGMSKPPPDKLGLAQWMQWPPPAPTSGSSH